MPRISFPACLAISLVLMAGATQAQNSADPIGDMTKTSTFDRAQHVNVGKTTKGKTICYFREEGGSHMLDIGMSTDGAFVRLHDSSDELAPDAVPQPPLTVFAGKELTKVIGGDVKATGEYEHFRTYDGPFVYVPNIKSAYGAGFVVVAKGDARSFLDLVVRARGEFVVVQSTKSKLSNVVAIYHFSTKALSAIMACAKTHVR